MIDDEADSQGCDRLSAPICWYKDTPPGNEEVGRDVEMPRRITKRVIVILGVIPVLLSVACQTEESAAPTVGPESMQVPLSGQVLTLGDISSDPAGTITDFQPMADYLAAHLADMGIQQGKVVVAPDLTTMIKHLETGRVDLFFDSAYPALTVYNAIGARPLLRRWKKGAGTFHTLIVTKNDSGITDLDGLLGHIVAFDDQVSTSGYLLPKAHLVKLGYQLTEVISVNSAVPVTEIGYVFANGEENVRAWVLQERASAAAVRNIDYEQLTPEIKSQLTVLARTVDLPRHIVLARPAMEEALEARIVKVLLDMDQTPEGQAALASFEGTSKFDALPGGPENALVMLQQLFAPNSKR